jgi:phenylacetate-CoA ligase
MSGIVKSDGGFDFSGLHDSMQRVVDGELLSGVSSAILVGRELRLKAVVLTGEMLHEGEREQLERFFGAPVINEYGCTEVGLLGFECASRKMHALTGAALVEVLDNHNRLTTSPGSVVITDLWPSLLSFDRLSIGDVAMVSAPSACPCGRTLPIFESLLGRTDSWIVLPSGKRIYDAILAYSMPAGVSRFQGEQTSETELQVRCVARHGEAVAIEEIRAALEAATDGELTVTVRLVYAIPAAATGKLRYFTPLSRSTIARNARL